MHLILIILLFIALMIAFQLSESFEKPGNEFLSYFLTVAKWGILLLLTLAVLGWLIRFAAPLKGA